ncbi:acyl-CoA thioesterase II [Pseudooceanicola batsensis HTCC2597]|uniref:Acyl-CoA thioesterase 2 n=1 Tax=Pseudooceanicola batsensis (strain ATCC BAA-863 / DSM 15984 / KCTC 12145 / HTCC2597) TaxID=252305 RepID=A3TT14_PSEBH|nr:acyl-CoA thioesterase II [Pseudooceanicola batsensis]EAQ04791.1 acyl-CoA thioesterase II [Pseudooceanicola batsensis HTCC2597]
MTDQTPEPALPRADDAMTPILTVERIEDNFFRGRETPNGKGRMFGGQVLGQALMAAANTVEGDRLNHSLHAYFMRPGDATLPVLYRVERDMDGRSFNTRRVIAIQNGQPILNLAASFQVQEEGFSHTDPFPENIPEPEDLLNEHQLAEKYSDQVPGMLARFLEWDRPVEIRPCSLIPPYDMTPPEGETYRWIRANAPMPDDQALHRAAMVYTSDMGLIGAALAKHEVGFFTEGMRVASLDHATWIHGDLRMDDWLLYCMDSPWSGGGRGLTGGRVFTRDGRLVATIAQEGMIRRKL